jgi:uncharacterized membrane protein YebE (DUF533 family)
LTIEKLVCFHSSIVIRQFWRNAVDAEHLIGSLIRGAFTSRRKRGSGALRFLTGGRHSFINASTLLGAVGVAWGIYDQMTEKQASPPAPSGEAFPPLPQTPPPPIPALNLAPSAQAEAVPEELLRLVRLTISASNADGNLSKEEMNQILQHAREAGAESIVREELRNPRPLREIVSGVTDSQVKADIYTLGFAIVRADEGVSGAERIYLAQLASHLGLDPETTARLEQEASARIDQAGRE